ncbi:MAG TPA: hypothetical protein PLU43_06600, partial [Lachnospiraceae bacterium]|nr:hypothetical protein [Lachnospiraceae bacterium]
PALIMLLAGAVACIVTYLNHYDLKDMLITLIWVLLIFLVIGFGIKRIFDSFHMPDENAVDDEGEVVEKQGAQEAESEEESKAKNMKNES